MSVQIGQVLDHYRVVDKIGEGGMGEVWRARDERLDRDVAVKVLPDDVADNPDRLSRFEREAKALAALSHPNILAIHEFGQDQGVAYAVTELLEGETLREAVSRQRLGWRKAAEITAAIADGLAAAHSRGVVHRDLKPENVFLTSDGRVTILDFGLARVSSPEPGGAGDTQTPTASLGTSPGTVLGTMGYMSPEQVRGEPADERSDIFALGCVAYEMVSGQRAFARDTAADTMAAILKEEPADVSTSSLALPAELAGTVRRCLEKRPESRFQSASDLAYTLRTVSSGSVPSLVQTGRRLRGWRRAALWTAIAAASAAVISALLMLDLDGPSDSLSRATGTETIESLAVLPFVNASGNPDTEYLSDGITENLINTLSQLPDLKVMSSSSVFRYKGQMTSPQDVGRELGVRAVLTGRLFQRGAGLSISVELMDTRDSTNIWGERYNRGLEDVIALEQEITRTIADKLRIQLTAEDATRLRRRYTANSEAYQLYLRGRHHWNKMQAEELHKAIGYFEQAIQLDATYAAAWAGIADSYVMLGTDSCSLPYEEAFPKALEAALTALEIDETFAEAHASLAFTRLLEWDWAGAETAFRRALELDSGSAIAHDNYAYFLVKMGRVDEGIEHVQHALELDPLAFVANVDLAWSYMLSGRYDDAISQIQKTIDLDPGVATGHWALGIVYTLQSRHEEAIAELQRARTLSGDRPDAVGDLGRAYALAGHEDEALRLLDELELLSQQRYVPQSALALVYIGLGQTDQALDRLEDAYEQHDFFLAVIKNDPRYDPLRSEPRFEDLLERMNFPD